MPAVCVYFLHCVSALPNAFGVLWVGSWRAHSSSVSHVVYVQENSTVMTASTDGLVRLWDEEVCRMVVL